MPPLNYYMCSKSNFILYTSLAGKHSIEEIKNVFTAFRCSEYCAEIWGVHVARYARLSFDYTVVYSYYKILLEKPDVAPWAFACLPLLIFPTGNEIAGLREDFQRWVRSCPAHWAVPKVYR
jgi:hypothetical protein